MAYNYAKEKRMFDAEWKRKECWYGIEGMSEYNIEAIRRFDLEQFDRDRAYSSRRRPLETACGSCYIQTSEVPSERCSWIDEVSDQQLVDRLHKLSTSDMELLTLTIKCGYGVNEIARLYGVTHSTISRKLTRIKRFLKNF